ncbi:acetoacetyl-CoA synthetase [Neomicrococcus aestuarii]|uniref:Acetoacetyl-CoA synthetase n=1 Tax=Neomicrococcus aestuarii TaxID=556325 RepID=A0A7W8X0M1_9MICC|nr:acetoacetate--CoA ligase [Neomicrococcus aestuarii]MBB5512988.1 acetoacetyl-CoA synthetase [Neomicrococcus aestuarii]
MNVTATTPSGATPHQLPLETTIDLGEITWEPSEEFKHNTTLWDFMQWTLEHRGIELKTYRDVLKWSVDDTSGFWDAVRRYFDVLGEGFGDNERALTREMMPGAEWYPNATLNFTENVLKYANSPEQRDEVALLNVTEDGTQSGFTWAQLENNVAQLAQLLKDSGVEPGDRVAAYLPNIPEALIGLLAAASIGAVWTINSPDLSVQATLDRLQQLEPKVLFGVKSYQFNGKIIDRSAQLVEIANQLPSVTTRILVPTGIDADSSGDSSDAAAAGNPNDAVVPSRPSVLSYRALPSGGVVLEEPLPATEPSYHRVPFAHTLWVLFSSGTTGKPKGIVHGHGGMLLEALKGPGLNHDMRRGDLYYVAANTSWMVWNTLVNNLATGSSVVTYAGSPMAGRVDQQFKLIAETGATMFATGAAYLSLVEKSGLVPGAEHDLTKLRSIMSTGSPLPDSTWSWVHTHVKPDVHLGSDSGGTDICGGFLGSNPLEPVRLGELQSPQLAVAVEAWDDSGRRVFNDVGDMIITRPMPSMPVFFWGDADGQKYRDAYFEKFPGVWTHGDWITELPSGGFVVHGRSDATLNRQGVRLGSADIYNAMQHIPEVTDSLVIGVEEADGGYYMPLFVVLRDGQTTENGQVSAELAERIKTTIRSRTSARHVPDEIIAVPGVPTTHAGKRTEVPVKKLFAGHDPERAVNRGSLQNPETIDWFVARANAYRDKKISSAKPSDA